MPRKRYDTDLFKEQETWAGTIAKNDADYKDYAGASLEDALTMANLDTMLFLLPQNHKLLPILKLMRIYFLQKKKAFFCSVGMNEISKLGAIKGGGARSDFPSKLRKMRARSK